MKKIVRSVCVFCQQEFTSTKKAKGCPACRRKRALDRTRLFLKQHPDYSRKKMKEYRARKKMGITLQPNKAQAKELSFITAQGWQIEMSYQCGMWRWRASKKGISLESDKTFPNAVMAKQDLIEALG